MKFKSKQCGISLTETLLVIVIGATIIAMVVRFLTQNNFTAKVAQANVTIQTLADASYTWLQSQRQLDFNGGSDCNTPGSNPISMKALSDAGLINFRCDSGPCKNNPWGGSITVSYYKAPNGSACDAQYVMITFGSVPLMSCRSLINHMNPINYKDQTAINNCVDRGSYFVAL